MVNDFYRSYQVRSVNESTIHGTHANRVVHIQQRAYLESKCRVYLHEVFRPPDRSSSRELRVERQSQRAGKSLYKTQTTLKSLKNPTHTAKNKTVTRVRPTLAPSSGFFHEFNSFFFSFSVQTLRIFPERGETDTV